jgi:large subunit ribosomal protein L22
MEVIAKHKNARITPRKLRSVRQIIIGLSAEDALVQLKFLPGKASDIVGKVLASAIANAKNNFEVTEKDLSVTDVIVDQGYSLKRHKPRSRGMANPYVKTTSHVTVVVEEAGGTKLQKKATKPDIETISTQELQQRTKSEPTQKITEKPVEAEDSLTELSKQQKTYGKMKTIQGGGDKQKTHRRKSIG